jgi:hypothetical protein
MQAARVTVAQPPEKVVNGVEEDNMTVPDGRKPYPTTTLNIGRVDNYFQGSIDDVLITNDALTAEQIYQLANPVNSGVSDVQISFRHAKDRALDDGLMLDMPFEEPSGSTLFDDITTNRLTGSCTNCPTAGETGKYGNAARFDGTDDYLTLGPNPILDGQEGNKLTVSAWINPSSTSGVQRVVSSKPSSSTPDAIGFGLSEGGLIFTTYGVKDYYSTQIQLNANQWAHASLRTVSSTVGVKVSPKSKTSAPAIRRAPLAKAARAGEERRGSCPNPIKGRFAKGRLLRWSDGARGRARSLADSSTPRHVTNACTHCTTDVAFKLTSLGATVPRSPQIPVLSAISL